MMMFGKIGQMLQSHGKNIFSRLFNIGISEAVAEEERRYIRFTNVVVLLTAIGVLAYIPYSVIRKEYLLTGLQVVDMCFVLVALWLNYKGYNKVARHAYLLIVNSFILINSCFIGYESRVHEFFYISYVVPFLLFRVKDFKNILAGVAAAIIFFNIYEHIYPWFRQYNVDHLTQQTIYGINVWMKFVLFGLAIYIMAYYNFSAEKELAATNQKLKLQAEELRRSNEDLEQFAYIISHDLKAPVRNISSFMKLLQSRFAASLTAEPLELVNLSKTCADRLSKQIEDLLSYCRVDRNLPPVSEVNLRDMIRTIEVELGEKIRECNADVMLEGNMPGLKNVHASMVHHIFQNLIANGIKFNSNPNPLVKIGFKKTDAGSTFYIADNGIGIEPGFENKLFQMFKRLHTQDKFEGTGIGLAVCKKIVTFYGGNIWFESKPGNGTTFFFTLPDNLIVPSQAKTSELHGREDISEAA